MKRFLPLRGPFRSCRGPVLPAYRERACYNARLVNLFASGSPVRRRLARLRAAAADGSLISLSALVGVLAYAIGVAARWSYILRTHHPRHQVFSDAMPITALAEVLADPAGQQRFFHTIWPPGASAFYALHIVWDPTLGSAAFWHFVLSSLGPLLIGHAGYLAYGARGGWAALALSSLHLGFIHYGGFFLAEQLFQTAVAVALWATVAALKAEGRRWRIVGGVASGAAWALACSFRPNALPVALFVALWLGVRWWRRRREHLVGLAAGALAFLLLVAPLSHRCSSLLGRFCPGSANSAMNIALGHAPPGVGGLHFKPQSGQYAGGPNHWWPPARLSHGYHDLAEVPASLYETGPVLAWVKDRFLDSPGQFALDSLGNALDLFGSAYWPDDYGDLHPRPATVLKQLVFMFVLVPGLALFGLQIARLAQRRDPGDATAFLTAVLVGMLLVAAASLGEARYRLPFDGALILFASLAYTRLGPRPRPAPGSSRPAALATAAVACSLAAALLAATAHPQLRLAARLSTLVGRPGRRPPAADTRPLAEFATPRPEKTAWDAPQNFVFSCRRSCPELRLEMAEVSHAARVEVSSDYNDHYELVFYRDQQAVGAVTWGAFEVGGGLKVVTRDVPASARAGFNSLGVRPLYGDSRYSVGHVRLKD
jgi:hypothetical protein